MIDKSEKKNMWSQNQNNEPKDTKTLCGTKKNCSLVMIVCWSAVIPEQHTWL